MVPTSVDNLIASISFVLEETNIWPPEMLMSLFSSASMSMPPLVASILIAASLIPCWLLITIVSVVPTLVDNLIASISLVFETINIWPPEILISLFSSASISIPPLVASILIADSLVPWLLWINIDSVIPMSVNK